MNPDREERRPSAEESRRRNRIAVEAYYLAERRGFRPGGELEDWLEAEKRIDAAQVPEAPQPAYRPINNNVREEIAGRERPSPLDAGLPGEPDERPARRIAQVAAGSGERRAAARNRPAPPKLDGKAA